MKKVLMILCLIILTGCKNELECKITKTEESYETQERIVFSFKDDKVNDVKLNYVMAFEDKETAKVYSQMFGSLDGEYEIKLNENILEINSVKNYEQYNESPEKLREEFEANGYVCK